MTKVVGSVVGSGAGSGSISQRSESGDPDLHQNVTVPNTAYIYTFNIQYIFKTFLKKSLYSIYITKYLKNPYYSQQSVGTRTVISAPPV
jgi:hypothetical protein